MFPKGEMQMANRHIKRRSAVLNIREMQIRTTVRYHFIPLRVSIIRKTTNNHFWQRWRKGDPVHCWQDCKLEQPVWKTVWLKKRKTELPCDPAILLRIYGGKNENTNLKRYMHISVHSSPAYNRKIWKQTKCPRTDEWIKNM